MEENTEGGEKRKSTICTYNYMELRLPTYLYTNHVYTHFATSI